MRVRRAIARLRSSSLVFAHHSEWRPALEAAEKITAVAFFMAIPLLMAAFGRRNSS
jgi:hypothetical protein